MTAKRMKWRVFSASEIGKSHIDASIPCQDALSFSTKDDVLIAVVCDGAGSAKFSHFGAERCANTVASLLIKRITDSENASVLDSVIGSFGYAASNATTAPKYSIESLLGEIKAVVGQARNELVDFASSKCMVPKDLYCTLIGVVAHTQGGFFFHIGDGLGIAHDGTDESDVISTPENGEYANETYFVVSDEWAEHLRITPFKVSEGMLVALMSDGAMPFVMDKGHNSFYRPFIDPVSSYLLKQTADKTGSEALAGTLADEKTHSITSDDKTLLLAFLTEGSTLNEESSSFSR